MSSPTNPNMAADLPPIGLRRVVYLQANRPPTVLDSKYRDGSYYEFNTEWRDLSKTPPQIWKLATINSKIDAVWFLLGPGSGPPPSPPALQFTPSSGIVVFPNVSTGNVNVFGGTGITVTGTTETLTIALSGSAPSAIETITGDDGTPESPSSNNFNLLGAVVANGTHAKPVYVLGSAATETIQVQQAKAVTPTPANNNDIGLASYSNTQFAVDTTSGMVTLLGGSNPAVQGFTPDSGSTVTADPATGLVRVKAVNPSGVLNPQLPTQEIAPHTLGVCSINTAKWIVDPTAGVGTHTKISDALTAASSGETIFVRPGTYSDALTLKAGVNLSAFPCDAYTPNVIISGNVTASYNGFASCSGINFKAASGVSIACSGASSSLLELVDCTVTAANGTGITVNDATFVVYLEHCVIGATAGNACFTVTSGFLTSRRSTFSSGDSTANTVAGTLNTYQSDYSISIATSGTGTINAFQSTFNNSANTTPLTTAGTGISITSNCYFNAGTATALSIGAGTTLFVMGSTVTSSNANAIGGAGTLKYGNVVFGGTSSTIAGTVTATALTVI